MAVIVTRPFHLGGAFHNVGTMLFGAQADAVLAEPELRARVVVSGEQTASAPTEPPASSSDDAPEPPPFRPAYRTEDF